MGTVKTNNCTFSLVRRAPVFFRAPRFGIYLRPTTSARLAPPSARLRVSRSARIVSVARALRLTWSRARRSSTI